MSFSLIQKYQQIASALDQAKNILIVSHNNPDGDALGASLALRHFLIAKQKEVSIFINDALPENFNFLPHFHQIQNKLNQQQTAKTDIILILDCGDFARANSGNFFEIFEKTPLTINIDHHLSNDNFGQINLVDLESSSTSEIIFYFFKFLSQRDAGFATKKIIDEKIAISLLTGLVTDTDFFINPNTSAKTLAAAGELIRAGAKLDLIWKNIYCQQPIKNLKLWGKALSRLQIDEQTELATTAIFQDDLENFDFDENVLQGLANFLNGMDGAKGVMVLTESGQQEIKGNLRTTRDDVDVAEIAKQYGGGGHRKAAGFRVKGKIVEDKKGWGIEKIN